MNEGSPDNFDIKNTDIDEFKDISINDASKVENISKSILKQRQRSSLSATSFLPSAFITFPEEDKADGAIGVLTGGADVYAKKQYYCANCNPCSSNQSILNGGKDDELKIEVEASTFCEASPVISGQFESLGSEDEEVALDSDFENDSGSDSEEKLNPIIITEKHKL